MTNNKTIGIDYTDQQLRVLVEEYIIQQRSSFTLEGVCNYVLYWAMEEGQTTLAGVALYESNKLAPADCNRVSRVLDNIIQEGRIVAYDRGGLFEKMIN